MTPGEHRPPRSVRRLLGVLFPGPRGLEALEDLDRAYAAVRDRHSGPVASAWYLLQLLRPDTWRLTWALRRIHRAETDGRAPAPRRVRGRGRATGLSLDLKLAWRMLRKSPGLAVVGVLGIGLGTGVGVGMFVFMSNFLFPELPLAGGDRIVALVNWNVETDRRAPLSLQDFVTWREDMRSVEPVAAAAIGVRPLVTGDALSQPVRAAMMTASAFQVARTPPLLGRYVLPEDEREGAPPVAVIGYHLWQTRFEGEPHAVGRHVLVGGVDHAVVGVMPPGFAFPRDQELWTALRTSAPEADTIATGALFVFGRLAPGVTRDQAQAELSTLRSRPGGRRAADEAHTRARIRPYTYPLDNVQSVGLWEAAEAQLMVLLLLVAIAVNLAVLVYARTAMRQKEIAVRCALGASRGRIVGQLFLEALLLSGFGAALGLLGAHMALRQVQALDALSGDGPAFWVDYGLRPGSVACAVALAVLVAVIVGVVPALKSTGHGLGADLRRLRSGASVRLGGVWTTLIVAQVAAAVTVLPTALHLGLHELRFASMRSTFPAHEFLSARLGVAVPVLPGMDGEDYRVRAAARFATGLRELEHRLEADSRVAGVTFEISSGGSVETEGSSEGWEPGRPLRLLPATGVATDYFDVLGTGLLAGRGLRDSDIGSTGVGVVVNAAFVRQELGGGPALGLRLRLHRGPLRLRAGSPTAELAQGPWLEIVGVVGDLQASALDPDLAQPMAYYAVGAGELESANLLVHVRDGDAVGFAPRFRRIVEAVDPDLRIGSLASLRSVRDPGYLALALALLATVLTTVLLLSAAGIHALMSLAVTRRRREIGIRTALGAHPARLLASIFSRAAWQLGLGGVLGSILGAGLLTVDGLTGAGAARFVGGVLVVLVAAGLAAAVGPARRGLGVQPMDALRED